MFENFVENISKWNVIVGLVIVLLAFALLVAAKPLARKFVLLGSRGARKTLPEEHAEQPFDQSECAVEADRREESEDISRHTRRESPDEHVLGEDGEAFGEESREELAAELERRKRFERKITREQADKITGFALVCKIAAAALAVTGCILVMFV